MSILVLGIGLILVIEGLVYALAPSIVESMLEALRSLPPERRRLVGLGTLAAGVALVWLARAMGA